MRTNDGQILIGTDSASIVHELRKLSHEPMGTEHAFMVMVARRAQEQTGKPVRTWTHDDFVADLLAAGLLYED